MAMERRSPGHNTHITGSKRNHRAFVVRQTPSGAALVVYKDGDDDALTPVNEVSLEGLTVTKVQQHDQGNRLLLLAEERPDTVLVVDLNRGAVVQEWQMPEDQSALRDVTPKVKHGDMRREETVLGLTSNAIFVLDGRVEQQVVDRKEYKTNPAFSALRTTGEGWFATAADDGQLRLYDKLGIAKTALPGLGDAVIGLDVTENGRWLLATCKDYLMLVPTSMPDGEKTGFQKRMGKNKPYPHVLRLWHRDLATYNIQEVNFTPARFDMGDHVDENWIATSTGPFIVTWTLSKIKNRQLGVVTANSIQRAQGKVVGCEFRFNHGSDLLALEENSVHVLYSRARRG